MKKDYQGLSQEAVKRSREAYGANVLPEAASETFFDKLKANLNDPIIRILILALAINVVFAIMGQTEWLQTIGIAFAVTLATLISTWSEHSNEIAFKKTQADASKIMTKVYRDGALQEIVIDDVVRGDLVFLQSGDKIPADGKLIDGKLKLDQAALNGESDEARKLPLPEGADVNFKDTFDTYTLFRGTVVTSGEAVLEVLEVGERSLYGQMASELSVEAVVSPLKEKLRNLADLIAKVGYTAGILVFFSTLFQSIVINNQFDGALIAQYFSNWPVFGLDFLNALILGVIIVVIAVPEGLPLMIALVLSLNMKKMLRSNVLVRKMIGIETSGNLNILYSDKTGTITKGLLEVVTLIDGENLAYDSYESLPQGLSQWVNTSVLCNTNAVLGTGPQGEMTIIGGNATEKAVLGFVGSPERYLKDATLVETIPFSSARKFSATRITGSLETTLIKGAPEKILPNCSHYYDKDGNRQPFTHLESLTKTIDELAGRSIRLLALATTNEQVTKESLPTDYTLVSILGIRDDVRKEAVEAIADVQSAGIQVVMITGDRRETAVAIAKEAGILRQEGDVVLTSEELNTMSDNEIKDVLPRIRVISRALPTDKSRLVRLSQELGLVCGMTGDGVNDGPALKRADVGFAMGSGTEVAKEAGDIVILDDNFKSIAHAVLYGRTIYRSIQKFITFQLTLNVAALATNFLAPFIGMTSPLTIVQMLWVNLVMDSLGALAFGSEPTLRRYMKERPKKRTESIVTPQMLVAVLMSGFGLTAIGLWILNSAVAFRWFESQEHLYTAYFGFFILFAVVNGFHARTERMNIFENISLNPNFLRIMAFIVVIQVGMIFIGGEILRTVPISFREWMIVVGMALLALPLGFLRKLIFKNKETPSLEMEVSTQAGAPLVEKPAKKINKS
ncbi:MAG: calcium-translocating P-type ATPase, PMCA-type [Turicibacter sp.]|nr:calcium-translocating P-type ATPase, PMCA-type [Turicibacter sp.]